MGGAASRSAEDKAKLLEDQGADMVAPVDQSAMSWGAYEGENGPVAFGGGAVKSLLQFFMGLFMFIVVVMVLAVIAYGASQVMQAVARPLAKFLGTIE
jgi:tetrahydromethanopterin S-methyltransferase subunit B